MIRRMTIALMALLLTAALALPAVAQEKEAEEKVFDFEGDTIEAEYLKPNAGVVETVLRDERKSLITIRMDFVDEIVQSAEEL